MIAGISASAAIHPAFPILPTTPTPIRIVPNAVWTGTLTIKTKKGISFMNDVRPYLSCSGPSAYRPRLLDNPLQRLVAAR